MLSINQVPLNVCKNIFAVENYCQTDVFIWIQSYTKVTKL